MEKYITFQVVTPPRGFDCRAETPRSWPHGSSLMNLMKMQSFPGLTGRVEFDPEGRRSNFALRVGRVTRKGLQQTGRVKSSTLIALDNDEVRNLVLLGEWNARVPERLVIKDPEWFAPTEKKRRKKKLLPGRERELPPPNPMYGKHFWVGSTIGKPYLDYSKEVQD